MALILILLCFLSYVVDVNPAQCIGPEQDGGLPTLPWCQIGSTGQTAWCASRAGPATRNRYGHSLVAVDEFIVMFGGYVESDGTGSVRFDDDGIYVLDAQLPRFAWLSSGEQEMKPAGRRYHSAVVHEGSMVIYGGVNSLGLNDLSSPWAFDLTTLEWSQIEAHPRYPTTDTPVGSGHYRFGHSAVMLDGEMLVFGGAVQGSEVCRADTWTLDTTDWSWTMIETSSAPSALCWHSAVVLGRKMVVVGGTREAFATARSQEAWVLDVDARSWETVSQPSQATFLSSAVVFRGQILVFSGTCNAEQGCNASAFDLNRERWQQVQTTALTSIDGDNQSPSDVPGNEARMIATSSSIFSIGGASMPNLASAVLRPLRDSADSFGVSQVRFADDNRASKSTLPGARQRAAGALIGDSLVLFGGVSFLTGSGSDALEYLKDTWVLNLRTLAWRSIAQSPLSHPEARHGHSMVSAGSASFLFGGAAGGFVSQTSWLDCEGCEEVVSDSGAYRALSDVWRYSLSAEEWSEVSTGSGPAGREGHAAVVVEGMMVVIGGVDFADALPERNGQPPASDAQYGDVWTLDLASGMWRLELSTSDGGPGALFQHAAVNHGGDVLVSGGCRVNADGSLKVLAELWALARGAGATWQWKQMEAVGGGGGRAGHTAALVGSSVVLFGGYSVEACGAQQNLDCVASLHDAWRLEPGEGEEEGDSGAVWSWTRVRTSQDPLPRRHHVAVMAGSDYLVVGGGDEWVLADGRISRVDFNDSAALPISSRAPNNTASHSGMYLALAEHYMSVLLPQRLLFGGARVRSSRVIVEPSAGAVRSSSSTLARVRSARSLSCAAADGCADLVLKSLVVLGGDDVAEGGVLVVSGVGLKVTLRFLTVIGVHCAHAGCVAFVYQGATLRAYRSTFAASSSLSHGGAVAAVEARAELRGCVFRGIRAEGSGGAVAVVDQPRKAPAVFATEDVARGLVVSNCTFQGCSAQQGGGALSCGLERLCVLNGSAFVNNSALGASDGGAVVSEGAQIMIQRCELEGNQAPGGAGGAVFWVRTPPVVDGDDLSLCGSVGSALYGACIASQAVRVEATDGASMERRHVFPGLWLDPPVSLMARDFYSQIVVFHGAEPVAAHAYLGNQSTALLQGATAVRQSLSDATFDFWDLVVLAAYSRVGEEEAVRVAEQLEIEFRVVEPLTRMTLSAPQLQVSFNSSAVCPAHHVLSLGTFNLVGHGSGDETVIGGCTACGLGSYTLHPLYGLDENGTHSPGKASCLPCPLGASECFGSTLVGVGTWESDGLQYNLVDCPAGAQLLTDSAGGAAQTGAHNLQRCEYCDASEYIREGAADGGCRPCPVGLICYGNETFVPRTPGSQWGWVGTELVLEWCPEGTKLQNDTSTTQACEECGPGEECAGGGCVVECVACAPGMYKDAASTTRCTLCPAGTYGPNHGASFAQCLQCPDFASTTLPGATHRSQCVCNDYTYAAGGAEDHVCLRCPPGAVCEDASCAVSSDGLACGDGTAIVGTWQKANTTGQLLLVACPDGFALINSPDGTSAGTFEHDAQRCQRCDPTSEYILNSSTDSCKPCPLGLECMGNGEVVPKTSGAVWVRNGSVLVLESCPTGFFVSSGAGAFDLVAQECLPCGAGEECVLDACHRCSPCPPGTYKDFASSDPCTPCPNNTFASTVGARSWTSCRACPVGAITAGPGQSQAEACVCEPLKYTVDGPEGLSCKSCPQGALCATECALQHENLTCPHRDRIVGTWQRNSQHLFVLTGCPDGFELINSTMGTSHGTFAHDLQHCRACSSASYNINPSRFQCQRCPAGLECSGGAEVKPKQEGAVWKADDALYALVSCPAGHFLSRASQLEQECLLCAAGQHCPLGNCTACTPCPPGTFKPSEGSYDCRQCPADTYLPEEGALSESQCASCPAGRVTVGTEQGQADACRCATGLYASSGAGLECFTCPQGALCADASCAFENANLSCGRQEIVGDWDRSVDGTVILRGCPDGFALVNSTDGGSSGDFSHDLQACRPCTVNQYIISDTDSCQPCPAGLTCDGTSLVVPMEEGSLWEAEGSVYVLKHCGSGYRPVVGVGIELQRCEACGRGEECKESQCSECTPCEPGYYKSTVGPSNCSACPLGTYGMLAGATSVLQCSSCPANSFSQALAATNSSQCRCRSGTYASKPPGSTLSCLECPIGARCADGACAWEQEPPSCPSSSAPVGEWVRVTETDSWVLVSCPDAYSLVNSTDGTSQGEFRAAYQECRACSSQQYIIDPNRHSCQNCPLGLICNGGSEVLPKVEGSLWVANGSIYRLQACGTGHAVSSGSIDFVAEAQTCVPCGRGQECSAVHCTECSPCQPGTYKSRESSELCLPCPANTFGASVGASSEQQCTSCPPGATTSGEGSADRSACECNRRSYQAVHPETQDLSCMQCPNGAVCRGSACSLSFENVSCPDAGDVPTVGTWRRSPSDDTYRLEACPDGFRLINSTDLSSRGTFSHNNQACLACPQDSYLVDFMMECQPCISGLICDGSSQVVSLVAGASWKVVGEQYWLESCPNGYKRVGFGNISTATVAQVLKQTCVACDVGEECPFDACIECRPCKAGSYKDSPGPADCRPCPLNSYGEVPGSTSLADCTACQKGAVTLQLGSSDAADCVCEPSTYRTADDPVLGQILCSECPQGALCADATCALRNDNQTCEDAGPIAGTWVPDSQSTYYLESCPAGYSLKNSTDGGEFEYASQRCHKCNVKEFIIWPDSQDCQACPEGLVCRGDDVVVPRVNGSTWVLQNDIFVLTGCPRGYRFVNESILTQRCEPCGLGLECISEPCHVCEPCAAGYYKDTISNAKCSICGRDTYNPGTGATNVADCRLCPQYAQTMNMGETSADACVCISGTYIVWVNGGPTCKSCPIGAQCEDGSCALRGDRLTCESSNNTGPIPIAGNWTRESARGEYRVRTCPSGTSRINALDGTSNGVFFHDAQQCRKCEPGRHYVLRPNQDTCQRCPTGLVCYGDEHVTPVTNGSEWVTDGPIYRLLTCPPGFERYNGPPDTFRAEAQECRRCPRGSYCLAENCTQCDACPAGTYKDEEGPGTCKLCPQGFYSDAVGATTFGACNRCPELSHTDGPGKTTADACVCASTLYIVNPSGESPICKQCPAGAICSNQTEGRACALALPDFTCPSSGPIFGEWQRNAEDLFVLQSCPAGTSMVNSSIGTSTGIFSHDIQQCSPCKTCDQDQEWCRSAEYVVDPNKFKCHACPYGAECNGADLRTVDSLDYIGALWASDDVGKMWLVSCPTGHRMMNHTGYENQQCKPCPEGEYIHSSDNPNYECHRCPEGGTCLNGGPPIFGASAVSSTVTIRGLASSPEDFTNQKRAVVVASLEASIPSLPGSVELTEICFAFGNQSLGCETLSDQLRRRSLSSPTGLPTGFPAAFDASVSAPASSSRTMLQIQPVDAVAGAATINFRVLSQTETSDTLMAKMSQPTFSSNLANTIVAIEPTFTGVTVPPSESPQLDLPPNSRGEQYIVDAGGRALLWTCNPGHLLVNDTFKLQHCADCYATTYSLDPLDHVGDDGVFTQRECSRCPRGAYCAGGTSFEPLSGSVWEQVYNDKDNALVYRLQSCTNGQALIRIPDLYAEDQCLTCPPTTYALEATDTAKDYLQPERAEDVVGDNLCLECPSGAYCPSGVSVHPKRGHWRGTNMVCRNIGCDKENNCNPTQCEAFPGAFLPGMDGEGEFWRVRAMVYRCKEGRCKQKTVEELRAEGVIARRSENASIHFDDANICFEGHKGVLCGVCEEGYAMTAHSCEKCTERGRYGFFVLTVVLFLGTIVYYVAVWRPLARPLEHKVCSCFPNVSEYEIHVISPAFTQAIMSFSVIFRLRAFFRASLTSYFKLLISYFQVSGNFVLKVTVPWPWPLVDLFLVMGSIFQLDVWTFPGMSCYTTNFTFRDRMVYMILAIPMVIALFSVPSCIAYFRAKEVLRQSINDFAYASLFFLYITYNVSARVTFEAFSCVNLGVDGVWVKSDVSAMCPANDPDQSTFWFAAVSAIIFPLGSPFLMYGILVYHGVPRTIKERTRRSYLLAVLHKFKIQNYIPVLITRFLVKRVLQMKKETKRARRASYAGEDLQLHFFSPSAQPAHTPGARRGRGRRGSLFGVDDDAAGVQRVPSGGAKSTTSSHSLSRTEDAPQTSTPARRGRRGSLFGVDVEAVAEGIQRVPSGAKGTISSLFNEEKQPANVADPSSPARRRNRRRSLVVDVEQEIAMEAAAATLATPTSGRRMSEAAPALKRTGSLTDDERENLEIDLELELEERLKQIAAKRTEQRSSEAAEGKDPRAKFSKSKTFRALGASINAGSSFKKGKLKVRVEEFRDLIEGMGIRDVGFSSLRGMIDRYGHQGFIDSDGLMYMVHHTLALESVLTGDEDPDSLNVKQLRLLCEAGQFEVAHYTGSASHDDETYRRRIHDSDPVKARKDDYKYEREELEELLIRRVKGMQTVGQIDVPEITWDGHSAGNRLALDRIGFLISAYQCRYWWYDLVDLSRKLLIGIVAVFVFDGTPSQVAAGTIVTIAYLLIALTIKPFINPILGDMHVYSLFMQAVTYFYGMVLATNELTNLAGEEGSEQRNRMGDIVLLMNIGLLLFPLFDIILKVRPSSAAVRRVLISAGIPQEWFGIHPKSEEPQKPRAKVQRQTSAEATIEAQAVFDQQIPDNMMGYLMTLKQFVVMRFEAAGPNFPPPSSALTLQDPTEDTRAGASLGVSSSIAEEPATVIAPENSPVERQRGDTKTPQPTPEAKIKAAKAALGMEAFEESMRLKEHHDGLKAASSVSLYHTQPTPEEERTTSIPLLTPQTTDDEARAEAARALAMIRVPLSKPGRGRRGSIEAASTVMAPPIGAAALMRKKSTELAQGTALPRAEEATASGHRRGSMEADSTVMASMVAPTATSLRGRRGSLALEMVATPVTLEVTSQAEGGGTSPSSRQQTSAAASQEASGRVSPQQETASKHKSYKFGNREKKTLEFLFSPEAHPVDSSGNVLDQTGQPAMKLQQTDLFASSAASGFVTGYLGYVDEVWADGINDPDIWRVPSQQESDGSKPSDDSKPSDQPSSQSKPSDPPEPPFSGTGIPRVVSAESDVSPSASRPTATSWRTVSPLMSRAASPLMSRAASPHASRTNLVRLQVREQEDPESGRSARDVKEAFRHAVKEQQAHGSAHSRGSARSARSGDSGSSFKTTFGGTMANLGSTVANVFAVTFTKKQKPKWPMYDGSSESEGDDDRDRSEQDQAGSAPSSEPQEQPPEPAAPLEEPQVLELAASVRSVSPEQEEAGAAEPEPVVTVSVFSPISRINIPDSGRTALYTTAAKKAISDARGSAGANRSMKNLASTSSSEPVITYRRLNPRQGSTSPLLASLARQPSTGAGAGVGPRTRSDRTPDAFAGLDDPELVRPRPRRSAARSRASTTDAADPSAVAGAGRAPSHHHAPRPRVPLPKRAASAAPSAPEQRSSATKTTEDVELSAGVKNEGYC